VVNHSRNGGIDLIQKLQREHWRSELDLKQVHERAYDLGYDRAQDKYEAQTEELQNENDSLRARIEELERENTRLTEQLQSAPKDTKRARPLSFDGKTSVGEESSRNKKSKTSQTKKPAPSKGKGKHKATEEEEEEEYRHGTDRELYGDNDDEEGLDYISETEGDYIPLQHGIPWQPHRQPPLISRLQPEQSTSRVPYQQSTPVSTQPTTEMASASQPPQPRDVANQWHTSLRVRTNGGRPTFAGQMPNNTPSDRLGGPALFRLQGWTNARLNPNGHVSIQEPTHWINNVPGLWLRPVTYWGTGQPLQKAREAARVPFDQRSYAQRWAVRRATQEGILPEDSASKEPDVEDEALLANRPPSIRVDGNGRLNVHDITVWMFLLMTQPETREGTIDWFWYSACLLFGRRGQYTEALTSLKLSHNIEDSPYVPQRFVHAGHWTTNDLARHFHSCGLRTKDANTLFFDFASGWLGRLDQPPKEPNWNRVPVPRNVESRGKAHKRRKESQKRNRERAALGSISGNWGAPEAPVPTQIQYDESPPLGEEPQLGANETMPPTGEELLTEAGSIIPPTGEEPQPGANTPMSVDPPAGGNPDSLEEDLSRM
jgi:hypothetical protein